MRCVSFYDAKDPSGLKEIKLLQQIWILCMSLEFYKHTI